MKKFSLVMAVVACAFVFTSLALAQDQMPKDKEAAGMGMMGGRMDKNMMMHKMMPGLMSKQMVASNDGGVIVLAGNKLYKYDKNLTLVKEAEIKVDMEGMKKMMEDMKAKCPMAQHDEKAEKPGDPEEPGRDMDMDDMPMSGK